MMLARSENMPVHRAYIGLGSNIGDGEVLLQTAWQLLHEQKDIQAERLSAPYRSAPVGMESEHWFTNGAGELLTTLSPQSLLTVLLDIEYLLGRRRNRQLAGYQDRSLDLDLLYYDDLVLDTEFLVLPHPRIGERCFVLQPLLDLLQDAEEKFCDPRDGRTLQKMNADLVTRIQRGVVSPQEIVKGRWQTALFSDANL